MKKLSDIRKEYQYLGLSINDIHKNPFKQFENWINVAIKENVNEPTTMALSTAGSDKKVSSRLVLLKGIENNSLQFYTSYESKKALQIEQNPFVSLLFFWPELERQVRIEGKAEKTSAEKSDEYFNSRPKEYKITAWASPQSKEIPDRAYLEGLHKIFDERYAKMQINRPPNWGGYSVIPTSFEFWQGRPNRLHDRILYKKQGNDWSITRLAP
ncbi:MAG: pyridoxamine 5'-phosphate oxidase [Bacteroidales bacterium]|nr:pyridoxamine 5'-phosphate oxidase [Bacteroidales bacterium]